MVVNINDVMVGPLVPADGVTVVSLDFDATGWEAGWLQVYKVGSDVALVMGVDYTVSNAGASGAYITLTTAANGTDAYTVFLHTPLQRSSDMQFRGELRSDPFNKEMDRIWQRLQLHDTLIDRCFGLSKTATGGTKVATSAGALLGFNASGSLTTLTATPVFTTGDTVMYDSPTTLFASTEDARGAGSVWWAGGYLYTEAASAATDHHVTNSASTPVKYYVQKMFGLFYPAAAFGFAPGVVTATLFKSMMAVAVAENVDVHFGAGTFDFNGADIHDGSLSVGDDIGSVRCVGMPGATIFEDIGSAHYSGHIKFHGVKFTNCYQPIWLSGAITEFDLQHCDFREFTKAVYSTDVALTLTKAIIQHNHFENTSDLTEWGGCVMFHRSAAILDVTCQHNTAKNITADPTTTDFIYGFTFGDDDVATTSHKRIKFNYNRIIGCGNHRTTTNTNSSFGCFVLGEDCEMIGNVVRDGGWLNALYMKGHGNTQAFNKVHDPEWAGITMKTAQDTTSKWNTQIGNVVTGVCDRKAAMRLFGMAINHSNHVDITTTAEVHVTEGGYSYRATASTTHGPLKISGTFLGGKGVYVTGAGDVDFEGTIQSDAKGIELISFGGEFGTVRIAGRIDAEDELYYVNAAERVELDLDGKTNVSGAAGYAGFSYTEEALTGRCAVTVTDSASDGLSLGQVISAYCKTGGSGGLTNHLTKLDLSVVTERDLARVVRHFADAGLSGKTKVALHNADIDLQGNSCTSLVRIDEDCLYVGVIAARVNGTMTRTIDGSAETIADLVIEGGLLNYVATDNAATHFNGTATRSRVGDNKTA